jgi:hypothetical protein
VEKEEEQRKAAAVAVHKRFSRSPLFSCDLRATHHHHQQHHHDSRSRSHCSAGSGITVLRTVQLVPGGLEMRWRGPCVFFALQDRDENLLVRSRVPPAVTSLASASECFSPRSSPCKSARRAWLGEERQRLANHGGTIRRRRRAVTPAF